MNCSCINSHYDHEPGYLLKDQVVKAAKQHKCCECGRSIEKGEEYELVVGKWDGGLSTYKTCLICCEVRKAFFCSWTYTQIWDDLLEYADQGEGLSQTKIAELPTSARDKVCDFIEDSWEIEE